MKGESLGSPCLDRDLTGTIRWTEGDKTAKVAAVASDGRFWVSRVLATIEELEKDTKHVRPLSEVDEDDAELRQKARQVLARLKDVSLDMLSGRARDLMLNVQT